MRKKGRKAYDSQSKYGEADPSVIEGTKYDAIPSGKNHGDPARNDERDLEREISGRETRHIGTDLGRIRIDRVGVSGRRNVPI